MVGDVYVIVNGPMRATRFVWEAAKRPFPRETNGDIITPQPHVLGQCASCGEPATYRLCDAISDSFSAVRNASKAWPHGGTFVCAACTWACKTLALRCAMWVARVADDVGIGGVWWVPLSSALDVLLTPPSPPFVVGIPLYGIRHGGENNVHRCVWPTNEGVVVPPDVLVRLQAKHTAMYASIATDVNVYPIQVDDVHEVVVDVAHWKKMRTLALALAADLVAASVYPERVREVLRTLEPPRQYHVNNAEWSRRVEPFRRHHKAIWWQLFTTILPIET